MSSQRARNDVLRNSLRKAVFNYEKGTSHMALALFIDPKTKRLQFSGNMDFVKVIIDAVEISGKKEEVTTLIHRTMKTSKKRAKGKRCKKIEQEQLAEMPNPSVMSATELRHWIPILVVNTTGDGQPHWNKEEKRVPWWPAGQPFKSPRTDWRPKKYRGSTPFVKILRSIATSYKTWLSKQDVQLPPFDDSSSEATNDDDDNGDGEGDSDDGDDNDGENDGDDGRAEGGDGDEMRQHRPADSTRSLRFLKSKEARKKKSEIPTHSHAFHPAKKAKKAN